MNDKPDNKKLPPPPTETEIEFFYTVVLATLGPYVQPSVVGLVDYTEWVRRFMDLRCELFPEESEVHDRTWTEVGLDTHAFTSWLDTKRPKHG